MQLTTGLLSARPVTRPQGEELVRSLMDHVKTTAPAGTVVPILASVSHKAITLADATALTRALGVGIHLDDTLKAHDVSMRITAPDVAGSTAKILEDYGTLSDILVAARPELEAKLKGPMTVVALAGSGLEFINAQTRLDKIVSGTRLAAGALDAGTSLVQAIAHINVPGAAELVLFAQIGADVLAVYRDVTADAQP